LRYEFQKQLSSRRGLRAVQQVEVFAGLEADGLARGDADLGTGAWVPTDPCLARLYCEHAKAAQLDTVAADQSLLHAVEDGIDGILGLGAWESSPFYDSLYKVLLNQVVKPLSRECIQGVGE
jgi:hypothetical protein